MASATSIAQYYAGTSTILLTDLSDLDRSICTRYSNTASLVWICVFCLDIFVLHKLDVSTLIGIVRCV